MAFCQGVSKNTGAGVDKTLLSLFIKKSPQEYIMSSPHAIAYPAFRPSIMGRNGVVTSGHHLASQAGIQIMKAGGNAIDAAIATAAALGVVEPQSSGAGGDGFILIYSAKTGTVSAINATGAAPTGATSPDDCRSTSPPAEPG